MTGPASAFPWAGTQNNLGLALWRLGERESGTVRLEEAVTAYREALQEWTRARVPLEWTLAQNNLGLALQTLGARESGTARLTEAVAAYREALRAFTFAAAPTGHDPNESRQCALPPRRAGERDGAAGRGRFRLSRSLAGSTRACAPLQWAMTQTNLGGALATLGERESGTARLEEAVAAYREALKELTRERVPLQWATTQHNLGIALIRLAARENGTARLKKAVAVFRDALQERTRERVPLQWANSTGDQGVALMLLAERRGDAEMGKRSRQLSRRCATAAMRIPPPSLKRNCQKPARLPKSSPSAEDHSPVKLFGTIDPQNV
jgi:tetratricopeptide (TPR) repeat protein